MFENFNALVKEVEAKKRKRKTKLDCKINEYVKIAKELYYGEKVIERIKQAKTEDEITRIMTTARKE